MENKETFSKKEIENIYRMKNEIEDLIKTKELFEYYIVSTPTATDKFTKHSYRNHPSFVIAGGVFASIFHKEKINDIDVFILGEHHIISSEDWITPNYDHFSSLIRYKEGKWNVQFRFNEDDNYYNPHVFGTATHKESGIQYIMTDHLTRQELLKDFDFVHCTVSYHEGKLNINRGAYDAIANKHLVPQNRKKKIKQWRQDKFIRRGWWDDDNPIVNQTGRTIKDIMDEVLDKKGVDIFQDALKHPHPVINPTNLGDDVWTDLLKQDGKISHKQVWTNSTKVI
jgi:hypothetical protein